MNFRNTTVKMCAGVLLSLLPNLSSADVIYTRDLDGSLYGLGVGYDSQSGVRGKCTISPDTEVTKFPSPVVSYHIRKVPLGDDQTRVVIEMKITTEIRRARFVIQSGGKKDERQWLRQHCGDQVVTKEVTGSYMTQALTFNNMDAAKVPTIDIREEQGGASMAQEFLGLAQRLTQSLPSKGVSLSYSGMESGRGTSGNIFENFRALTLSRPASKAIIEVETRPYTATEIKDLLVK